MIAISVICIHLTQRFWVTQASAHYTDVWDEIQVAEQRLSKTVASLQASHDENDVQVRAQLADAAAQLRGLQRRVSAGTQVSLSELQESLAMVKVEAQDAARELSAKKSLAKQSMAAAISKGMLTANSEEESAISREEAQAAKAVQSEVQGINAQMVQLSQDMTGMSEAVRQDISSLGEEQSGVMQQETARQVALGKVAAQAESQVTNQADELETRMRVAEHQLSVLNDNMRKQRHDDIKALTVKVDQATASAKSKLQEDVQQAMARTAAVADESVQRLQQRIQRTRSSSLQKANSVAKEYDELQARAEQHYSSIKRETETEQDRLKALGNSTQSEVALANIKLDTLVKRISTVQDEVREQQARDREMITSQMATQLERVRSNLTAAMGMDASTLAALLQSSISGAEMRLTDQERALRAMAQNLNSSVSQVSVWLRVRVFFQYHDTLRVPNHVGADDALFQARLDTLSLISDQGENVSYAGNTLQASEEEMQRRIHAVDVAAKALEGAQKVGSCFMFQNIFCLVASSRTLHHTMVSWPARRHRPL